MCATHTANTIIHNMTTFIHIQSAHTIVLHSDTATRTTMYNVMSLYLYTIFTVQLQCRMIDRICHCKQRYFYLELPVQRVGISSPE